MSQNVFILLWVHHRIIKLLVTVEKEDRGKEKSFILAAVFWVNIRATQNERLIYREIIQLKGTEFRSTIKLD